RFNPKNPKSLMLRTHCQTSGWSLTARDPLNNIVRTTIEAMAGVLGGTQSLHTNSYDEALSLPTKTAARVARNTQLILQEETDLCHTADPLAGSYAIESLTARLVKEARALIAETDALGGMAKAIEQGMPAMRITGAAARKQAGIDKGEITIVGVNKYQAGKTDPVEILNIDNTEVLRQQVERLQRIKSGRDEKMVRRALKELTVAAGKKEGKNLLELAVGAARARATVGEISGALEEVWGRHTAQSGNLSGIYESMYKNDELYQQIRQKVVGFAQTAGRRPRILVAKVGQDGHDRGAKVVATAFADLGFDVDIGPLFSTPEEVARQAVENDVHAIGISTLAAGHKTLIPNMMKELQNLGAGDIVVIAGGVIPEQDHEYLRSVGVREIFGPGTNIPMAASRVIDVITR
ncbi:MAG: methylmalonyl-CoA mutase family protein, partial [Balneolales bacterium]